MAEREQLKIIRVSRGFSRKQVADAANITESYYGMIEQGVRRPTLDIALLIADCLGTAIEAIFVPDNSTICCNDHAAA